MAENTDPLIIAERLIERSAAANAALIAGDVTGYYARIAHAPDFCLMSPFGGPPTHGPGDSPARIAALEAFFQTGTATFEVVRSYTSADMVVIAAIERQRAAVGGLPEQDWSLRITLVFVRDGAEWKLAHRHADALVHGIDLAQCAALARGKATG